MGKISKRKKQIFIRTIVFVVIIQIVLLVFLAFLLVNTTNATTENTSVLDVEILDVIVSDGSNKLTTVYLKTPVGYYRTDWKTYDKEIYNPINNKELEKQDAQPDDYYGVNILDYYIIEPTQTDVQNFICYEVDSEKMNEYNKAVKYLTIKFIVLCDQKNIEDKDTYIARHDLLAAILLKQFNHTNYFGTKIECTYDVSSVVDSTYACRTLIFTQITDNNLVKTQSKIPRLVNKDIVI